MEATATYTQFMDQPVSQLDPKELLELAKKNLKIFGEIEQKQFKRLESQLKYEKEIDKKEKENRTTQDRRQKELDDLREENFKKEFDRAKEQKEKFDKIKSFSVSDVIPSRTQELEIGKSQEEFYNKNERFFERISSTLELIPEKIQKTIRKPQDEKTGEQKNLGEEIIRVSFNKEGVQILKTLLDPIYKALNANTENLEKMLKQLTDADKSGGNANWLLLLAGGVFVLLEEIYKRFRALKAAYDAAKTRFWEFIDDIKAIPERIKRWWRESKIVQWLQEKWAGLLDDIKNLGTYIKSYWDEFVVKPFKEKWNSFITRAKEILNFDELKKTFQEKWGKFIERIKAFFSYDELVSKFEKAGEGLKGFYESIKQRFMAFGDTLGRWYEKGKGIFDSIKNLFSAEGFFGKIFEGVKWAFNGLKGTFESLLKFLDPLINMLKAAGGWIKYLFRFFEWIALIIDPLIAAGKTLFSVWGNDNLSFFQKTISVITAAVFGLADGLVSLIGLLSEGITGIWNWITGNGWKSENAVGNWARGLTNDYEMGGIGRQMGEGMAAGFEEHNKKGSYVENWYQDNFNKNKVKINEQEYAILKKKEAQFKEDGTVTEDEQEILTKFIDEFSKTVDDFIMEPKGMSSYIIDRKNNQTYKTAPTDEIIATKKGGIIDKSLQDLKNIMTEVNRSILMLTSNVKEQQSVIVNNNNTTVSGSSDNKKYLFKPVYDPNADNRSAWWNISRQMQTTT